MAKEYEENRERVDKTIIETKIDNIPYLIQEVKEVMINKMVLRENVIQSAKTYKNI